MKMDLTTWEVVPLFVAEIIFSVSLSVSLLCLPLCLSYLSICPSYLSVLSIRLSIYKSIYLEWMENVFFMSA